MRDDCVADCDEMQGLEMLNRIRQFGLFGLLRLARDLVITRLAFPGARLIRYPFYFRGTAGMRFGKQFTTGVGARLEAWGLGPDPCLIIGDNVQINDHVHIGALEKIEIGEGVLIASRVFITDHDHGSYGQNPASDPATPPAQRLLFSKPVHIMRNVWIGEQVCILPGVTLGEGCIIGAGSVVTHDVPPRSIAVGNPARVIKAYDGTTGQWLSA